MCAPLIVPQEVNHSIDLLQLAGADTALRRVASTGAGEYAGACPRCGGEDRFHVQLKAPPGKRPEGSRWMCRQCSPKWGDAIGYVMWRNNVGFQEAARMISTQAAQPALHPANPYAPARLDRLAWVCAAFDFIEACEEQLWQEEGQNALDYLHWRGLQDQTLKAWRIGYNPTAGYGVPSEWGWEDGEKFAIPKGIVIPCQDGSGLHYLKIRQSQGEPRYLNLRGGHTRPFGLDTFRNAMTTLLFEGEFDALLAMQTGLGIGFASLPAGQPIRSEYAHYFESVDEVIICYDNDPRGEEEAARLARIPGFRAAGRLPEGKDLTEFFLQGGDVFEWVNAQLGGL